MFYVREVQTKICNKISILVLAAVCAPIAGAAIIPVLNSGSPVALGGGNFGFNYTADLQQDERLDPAATMGVTCPGPSNTKVQCQPPGTFFTIYDINDFVSASTTAPGWTLVTQTMGLTPSSVNGSSLDGPLVNVSFIYNGPVLHAAGVVVPISGFQIVSRDPFTTQGFYSFQATKDVGDAAGNTDQGSGPTTVPSPTAGIGGNGVPEPGSILLLGFGLVAIGLCRRFVPGF